MYSILYDYEQCIKRLEHNHKGLHIFRFYMPYHLDILDLWDILFFDKYRKDFPYNQTSKYILADVYLLSIQHFVHNVRIYKDLGTPYQYKPESMGIHHHFYNLVLHKLCMDLQHIQLYMCIWLDGF